MKTGILCIFIITFVYLSAQIVTDFSTGLDNWIAEGDCNYFWYATGGNPTGYLRIEDDATGDINRCYAPAEFLGDWSGADSDDTISADIFLSTNTLEYIGEINYVFRISGPGGIAKAITDPRPTPSIWHTYSVSLDPEEWTITAGDWNSILEDVQSFVVTGEFIDGDEFDKIEKKLSGVKTQFFAEEEQLKKIMLLKQGLMQDLLTGRIRVPESVLKKYQTEAATA